MREKIYFHLLLICGIWFHGIIGTLVDDEEIEKSSVFLVRHKRVVSYRQGEDTPTPIQDVKYFVGIKYVSRILCTGSILSNHVVITSARCVIMSPGQYQILSSTSLSNHGGQDHDVIDIRRKLAIALLTTGHPFVYGTYSHNIQLYTERLVVGALGQITEWGSNWREVRRGTNPPYLRSIRVCVINRLNCVYRYRLYNIAITEKEVCTYDPVRHSSHIDFGAGLVVNGHLAGVLLWSRLNQTILDPEYPEVFAFLQHRDYNSWIRTNLCKKLMHVSPTGAVNPELHAQKTR